MKIVYLDTETTGLDIRRHEPWELGAYVSDIEHMGITKQVHFIWEPEFLENADAQALQVNRYYERTRGMKYANKLNFSGGSFCDPEAVARYIADEFMGAIIVGNNPAFDVAFLEKFCHSEGHVFAPFHRKINVVDLALGALQLKVQAGSHGLEEHDEYVEAIKLPHSSNKVLNAAGCPPNENPHTALGDAKHVRDAFLHLRGV